MERVGPKRRTSCAEFSAFIYNESKDKGANNPLHGVSSCARSLLLCCGESSYPDVQQRSTASTCFCNPLQTTTGCCQYMQRPGNQDTVANQLTGFLTTIHCSSATLLNRSADQRQVRVVILPRVWLASRWETLSRPGVPGKPGHRQQQQQHIHVKQTHRQGNQ